MNTTTTKLINSKWEAIGSAQSSMNKARNDLFDNVALALSRMDGKMNFLNGENFEGKPFLEGHAQNVGFELQQEIQDARKALDKIFVNLTDAKEKLWNS